MAFFEAREGLRKVGLDTMALNLSRQTTLFEHYRKTLRSFMNPEKSPGCAQDGCALLIGSLQVEREIRGKGWFM